jgi:hypothetical protein
MEKIIVKSGPLGLELFSISNWSFTSCSVINYSGQILSRAKSSFGRFGSFSIFVVREAKTECKNKLTSQLIDKSIPPDKWWRIAKSVCKLNKCNKVSPPIKHEGRIQDKYCHGQRLHSGDLVHFQYLKYQQSTY